MAVKTNRKTKKKSTTKKTSASSGAKKKSTKKAATKPAKKIAKTRSKKETPKKQKKSNLCKKIAVGKTTEGPVKKEKSAEAAAKEERRSKAAQALQEALNESEETDEDEFDPEAFFAASGGKGLFRAHVMRKERVDLCIPIRYRKDRDPIIHNAELINLSKGGLCLRTDEVIKEGDVLRVEIPLPHTSELFRVQTQIVWSQRVGTGAEVDQPIHTGMIFMPMSLAKQTVINNFIQQRRDELIMAKIGLDKFTDSVPVAGLD